MLEKEQLLTDKMEELKQLKNVIYEKIMEKK